MAAHPAATTTQAVLINLTPIRNNTGPARVLAMVEGRSKAAIMRWLQDRDEVWRSRSQVVASHGLTCFKTATTEELPDAVAVMDPFHVVRLAGGALDECRRVPCDLHGRRGRRDDVQYWPRRALHNGTDRLTDRQRTRLTALFAIEDQAEVEATWGIYQRLVAAYGNPVRSAGATEPQAVIASITESVPKVLIDLRWFGWILTKRAADVLTGFDRPGTSNGPTEAINGRRETCAL